MQLKPVAIGRLFEVDADVESVHGSAPSPQTASASNSVSSLLGKLITGQLIYPWIELTNTH